MKNIEINLSEEEILHGLYNKNDRKSLKKKPCKHKRSVSHKGEEICLDCKCKIS